MTARRKRAAPDSAGAQQAGRTPRGTFAAGVSGNPRGRKHGSRNRATLAAAAILEGEGSRLARKAVELALAGDVQALSLCLARLIPPARERRVELDLPAIEKPADALAALSAIARAAGEGEIEPSAAEKLGALVGGWLRAHEVESLEQRLAALEAVQRTKRRPAT